MFELTVNQFVPLKQTSVDLQLLVKASCLLDQPKILLLVCLVTWIIPDDVYLNSKGFLFYFISLKISISAHIHT